MADISLDEKILKILEESINCTNEQIATMLGVDVAAVSAAISDMEKRGVILGCRTVVNWEKTEREFITAQIELRVTPHKDEGFDAIAKRIYQYPEVRSLYLMSGGYDLFIIIEGKTLKEVAMFVSEKLSAIDGVLSTATHFVLKKYKEDGVLFERARKDERLVVSP